MRDTNQRIKTLQIALQYTLPRMKQATNEISEDLSFNKSLKKNYNSIVIIHFFRVVISFIIIIHHYNFSLVNMI